MFNWPIPDTFKDTVGLLFLGLIIFCLISIWKLIMKYYKGSSKNSNTTEGSINVNGKSYRGNSVTVVGNKVIIDGKDQTPDAKEIKIEVVGNISELKVDYAQCVNIKGDVTNLKTSSGDVSVTGNVSGSIMTSSGDVDCGNVGGNIVTSSGDIKYKR